MTLRFKFLCPLSIVSATGAGDALVTSIFGSLAQNLRGFEYPELEALKKIVEGAQAGGALTLQGESAVPRCFLCSVGSMTLRQIRQYFR
jgi:sugar/nucleoside kinase (ribokinase family)